MGALFAALCPCAALTARLQPRGRAPAQAKVHLEFSPSCVHRRGERIGGEWGSREEEAAPRYATGAPRPEAIRVRGEPYLSPREKEWSSALGGKPRQRKEQGSAMNTYIAPPSTSSRRRLHLRPVMSVVAFLFLLHLFPLTPCLWARLRAAVRHAPLFLHKLPPLRATPEGTQHCGHPRPQCRALPTARRLVVLFFAGLRDTPRRAAAPRAGRRAVTRVLAL
jgi:hypothetical protein